MSKKKKSRTSQSVLKDQVLNRLIGLGEMIGASIAMFLAAYAMSIVGVVATTAFIPFAILFIVGWLELLVGVRIHKQA